MSDATSAAAITRPQPQSAPPPPRIELLKFGTADEYAQAEKKRRWQYTLAGVVLAVFCALSFVGTPLDSLIVPLVLILVVATPILIWRIPTYGFIGTYLAVCTVELFSTGAPDAITDRIPFFVNINTILQVYHLSNAKGIPLNLFEVFILTAGLCSLFRAVFTQNVTIKGGPLLIPILMYIGWVMVAYLNGKATGGDFKLALQETRAQFYFLAGYLMAYNLTKEKKDLDRLLWITILGILLKGFLYTFRRYVTMAGQALPDQGVGSHEEAFLFDAYTLLLLVFALCGANPKMRNVMLMGLPLVILGNLACNRRSSTAALAVVLPLLLVAAIRGLEKRRKFASIVAGIFIVVGPMYYMAFKNSESAIAQPARAIKSQFQPDERDASSNEYRDKENADQLATIKSAPWGYGYGKRFLHAVPIADIADSYEWWDLLPHNQILWVWMRTGWQGFICFWIMVAAIVIYAGFVFRDSSLYMDYRATALFAMLLMGLLLIFGLLDLQLSNFRDMLFASTWFGVLARLRELPPPPPEETESARRKGRNAGRRVTT